MTVSYPIVAHSWTILFENVAIKHMDKSCFLHRGSVIPLEIRKFFGVENLKLGQKITVYFKYECKLYEAFISNLKHRDLTRLFWKPDFSEVIRREFPDYYFNYKENRIQVTEKEIPRLLFQRTEEENVYVVHFEIGSLININNLSDIIELDLESIRVERYGIGQGKEDIQVYGDKHELDPMLRKKTIEFHGLNCSVCGFNFEEVYGERGKDFIEIHHIKPIPMEIGERLRVNYETDFVPICANCHRMIHRRYDEVVSIEELKEMLKKPILNNNT